MSNVIYEKINEALINIGVPKIFLALIVAYIFSLLIKKKKFNDRVNKDNEDILKLENKINIKEKYKWKINNQNKIK